MASAEAAPGGVCLDAGHRCGERQGRAVFDHGINAGHLLVVAVRADDSLLGQLVQLCLAQLRHGWQA
jgi:hypothetical protein